MPMTIKNPDTGKVVRELATTTGEAVITAVPRVAAEESSQKPVAAVGADTLSA